VDAETEVDTEEAEGAEDDCEKGRGEYQPCCLLF
jgi:hypothetical protein